MKVTAKANIIYNGYVYKTGEEFEILEEDAERLGYSFPWLKNESPADDLVASELPPLDTTLKKGKR